MKRTMERPEENASSDGFVDEKGLAACRRDRCSPAVPRRTAHARRYVARLVVTLTTLLSMGAAPAEEMNSRDVADALLQDTLRILVADRICKDEQDCRSKTMVLYEAERACCAYVNIYKLQDPEAIGQIARAALTRFLGARKRISIFVSIRAGAHESYGTFERPFVHAPIEINLRGE